MKKHIIFSQQPSDIKLVLSIYKDLKGGENEIYIYCVNVENNFKFLKHLNLDISGLFFIPYPNLFSYRKPWIAITNRIYLRSVYNTYFSKYENNSVYFWAKGRDWFTTALINKLIKNNTVFFKSANDTEIIKLSLNYKRKLIFLLYQFIAHTKYSFYEINKREMLYYDNNKIKECQLKDFNLSEFKITYNAPNNKSILFIDVELNQLKTIHLYNAKILSTIEYLNKTGYYICRKSHPRLGGTKVVNHLINEELHAYIPMEFLNVNNFKFAFGIFSLALADVAKRNILPTYSILNLFQIDESVLKTYENHINNSSNKEVILIDNIAEIK